MTEFTITGRRAGTQMTITWADGEFVPPGVRPIVEAFTERVIAVTPVGPFIERDLADAESAWRAVASMFDVVTEASGYVPPDAPETPAGSVS